MTKLIRLAISTPLLVECHGGIPRRCAGLTQLGRCLNSQVGYSRNCLKSFSNPGTQNEKTLNACNEEDRVCRNMVGFFAGRAIVRVLQARHCIGNSREISLEATYLEGYEMQAKGPLHTRFWLVL